MKVLVLGATGATGRLVVQSLLEQQQQVIALVRNTETLSELEARFAGQLNQIKGTALSLSDSQLSNLIAEVDGITCCLGHNLTLKGIYGAPRMLVTDSIKRIVSLTSAQAEEKRTAPLKIVLMNSSGVRNKDQHEPISFAQHLVLGLIRTLVPPHRDNEQAADYLRTLGVLDSEGINPKIEWSVVRPDSLIDQDEVSDYDLHPAPIRSAIFDSGKVSRINVANVMSRLITDAKLWGEWQGKMPLVYNANV